MIESPDIVSVSADGREIRLRYVREDLEFVRSMWDQLYVHQKEHGLLADVPPGAFDEWSRSLATVLGRFGFVIVATVDSLDVGFCAGRMRPMPAWYGGGYAGYISDVFVDSTSRGLGIGRLLVETGVLWFRDHEVQRVELHVVWRNELAMQFYRRLGWVEDVVQLVKLD